MIITCWYRDKGRELADGTHEFEFNHISNGYHEDHAEPAAMYESQERAWAGYEWRGIRAHMENGVVTDPVSEGAKILLGS